MSSFAITLLISLAQVAGAVEYTDCISAEGKTTLDMTPNHLMVRLLSWNFGECGVPPLLPLLPGPL